MKLRKTIAGLLVLILGFAHIGMVHAADKPLSKLLLNKTELALEIGDSAALTATALYTDGTSENVTVFADWSSDNPSVATVYNGTVSAKGEGTATILAVYKGEPQSVQVTVSKKVKALTKDRQRLDLRKEETAEIRLTAIYNDNTSEDVSDKAEWSTSDANVATVINGKVTAHSPGSATIAAKYGSQSISVPVNVEIVRRLDPGQRQVSLLLNETFAVTLIATYPDGSTRDVAADAEWSSSDESIADVIQGKITAYGAGSATLTATYGTKTATIEVDVDKTRKLSVDRQNVFMRVDETRQLVLTATYPDNSTANITNQAQWSSSDENVVAVSNGLLDAVGPGSAVVTAQYGTKSIEIAVDVETTRYLQLSEETLTLKVDESKEITLQAIYIDGSTEDITNKVEWKSNREEVAYVLNGRVYARKMGEARITASYGGRTVSLTVDVDVPRRLAADPKSVAMQVGDSQQIRLLAVYADGREEWITDKAEWSTSDEEVADVRKGLVTGLESGKATITAKYGDRTVTIRAEIGLANDLRVDLSKVVVGVGESKQLTLTAAMADGTSKNVTGEAQWKSSAPAVADVVGGVVKGYSSGKATITAEYGGKSVSVQVEVDLVQKLEISKRILSLKSGEKAQLTVIATYSDGSEKDVTAEAEWRSGNYKVADVSRGTVTAVGYGKTTITAKYGTKSVSTQVDVNTVKYLQTDVVIVKMKVGETKQLRAIATYNDGTEADVTKAALWTSSRALRADVKDGLIRAHDKGKVTITVSYGGLRTKVSVTIE